MTEIKVNGRAGWESHLSLRLQPMSMVITNLPGICGWKACAFFLHLCLAINLVINYHFPSLFPKSVLREMEHKACDKQAEDKNQDSIPEHLPLPDPSSPRWPRLPSSHAFAIQLPAPEESLLSFKQHLPPVQQWVAAVCTQIHCSTLFSLASQMPPHFCQSPYV